MRRVRARRVKKKVALIPELEWSLVRVEFVGASLTSVPDLGALSLVWYSQQGVHAVGITGIAAEPKIVLRSC